LLRTAVLQARRAAANRYRLPAGRPAANPPHAATVQFSSDQ